MTTAYYSNSPFLSAKTKRAMNYLRYNSGGISATLTRKAAKIATETTLTTGADKSHWETITDILAYLNASAFTILKLTEGTAWKDTKFDADSILLKSHNAAWGAYHFFRPALDPIAQAEWFYQKGQECGGFVRYAGDFEVSDGVPAATIRARVKTFLERLEILSGRPPLLYTSPGWWNSVIGNTTWASHYLLWVAHWYVANPTLPLGFSSWVLWQDSDRIKFPGITENTDRDYYNGDVTACRAFFENGQSPAPVPMNEWAILFDEYARTSLGWNGPAPLADFTPADKVTLLEAMAHTHTDESQKDD